MKFRVFAVAIAVWMPACAQRSTAWPDTYVARLQALALVQTINVEVLAARSATLILEDWCRDHHLAGEPRIVADLVKGVSKAPSAEQRERLQVGPQDEVKYRHVRLRCGDVVMSEADNWYVPSRLTAEMNRVLETSDVPFGRAVQALEPYRRTFQVQLLWSPLPAGWEGESKKRRKHGGVLKIPDALFEHRAILYTRDNKPFSEVDEVYQRQLLAFPAPR